MVSSVAGAAATYRRISDDREGLELGITRQREDLLALAQQRGYEVVADYPDDDISASTRSTKPRPQYARMIEDAKAGKFGIVLAYTSSRLTRRPRELEDLIELSEKHGVRFEYVRSPSFDLGTADGRQVARTLAAGDAAEAERTSERVTRARAALRRMGRWPGGRLPWWLQPGDEPGSVAHRPGRVEVIRRVVHELLHGRSLAAVYRELGAAGIEHPPKVELSMYRSVYLLGQQPDPETGEPVRNDSGHPVQFCDPVISVEDFRRLQQVIAPIAPGVARSRKAPYLLSGLVFCRCGNRFDYQNTNGHQYMVCRSVHTRYRPTDGRPRCPRFPAGGVHQAVEEVFLEAVGNREAVREVHHPASDTGAELARLSDALTWFYSRVKKSGPAAVARQQAEIAALETQIEGLTAQGDQPARTEYVSTGQTYGDLWAESTDQHRRELLRAGGFKVVVVKYGHVEAPARFGDFVLVGSLVLGDAPEKSHVVYLTLPVAVAERLSLAGK